MTVADVYERYRIMPALQLHQLRVAAVAKMICENSLRELDAQAVILAGLFHDMANILKSDLTLFPEFLEPDGIGHWQQVKDDLAARYGTNEHAAARRIAEEIGLPETVVQLIDGIGFSKLAHIRDHGSAEQQVIEYADLRVGPHGVLTMHARLEEAKHRYAGKRPEMPRTEETYEQLLAAAYDVEQHVFADCALAPDDISEESVQPVIGELRELRIA